MRKLVGLVLVLALLTGAVMVIGCGDKKTTVKVGDEEVEYTEDGGEVTIESDEGTMTTSTEISEEDLGCPIYPDAEIEEGEAGTITMNDAEGGGTMTSATFYTEDSIAEVVAWYKEKLAGEPNLMDMSSTAGGEEMGMFSFGSGDAGVTVVIAADETEKGKTLINITRGAGSIMAPEQ